MGSIMALFSIGFAGGMAGFAHCLGMCGGFVVHLSLGKDRRIMFRDQLLWFTGKMGSYLFLGSLAGYAGLQLQQHLNRYTGMQNLLGFFTGTIIILMGIILLGLLPVTGPGPRSQESIWTRLYGMFSTRPGSPLVLGMTAGLLPCPIVLAALASAVTSGSVLSGLAIMGGLGAGTMLPLAMLGSASRLTGMYRRKWAARAGGGILVALGLFTILRGTEWHHRLLGCTTAAAPLHSADSKGKTCCPEGGATERYGR